MRVIPLSIAMMALVASATPLVAQTRTTEFQLVDELEQVDGTTQTHDAPIRDDLYDRMTVGVRLGGSGPFHFLVDTGSDRTAVSRQVAARLGLRPAGVARLHSVTGETDVVTVRLPQLELSGKTIDVVNAPLLERTNIGADGILGTDSLRAQRLMFDFSNGTMTIVPSEQRITREERDAIVVEARRRNGRLIITRARADNVPVVVVLDTGSQVTIANEPLRRALANRRAMPRGGKVELLSVTGQKLIGDYMFLRKLDLGSVALSDLVIVFADAHTFRLLDLADRPAILLGMNALRGFDKVSIDFNRSQMRVIAPQKSEIDGMRMVRTALSAD